jgi:hypothetical protein
LRIDDRVFSGRVLTTWFTGLEFQWLRRVASGDDVSTGERYGENEIMILDEIRVVLLSVVAAMRIDQKGEKQSTREAGPSSGHGIITEDSVCHRSVGYLGYWIFMGGWSINVHIHLQRTA